MFIKIFKSQRPVSILLIPLVFFGLWFYSLFHYNPPELGKQDTMMPLYELFIQYCSGKFWYYSVLIILIFSQVFLVTRLNSMLGLIETRTYLPVIVFLFIISSYIPLQELHPALIGNTFFLLFLYVLLYTSKNRDLQLSNYFLAGFILSIGSLFYAAIAYFIIIAWFAYFFFRPFRFREWLVSLIGLIIPYFLFGFYHYFVDNFSGFIAQIRYGFLYLNKISLLETHYLIFYTLMALLVLVSVFFLYGNLHLKKIEARKYYKFILWILLITLIVFIFAPSVSYESIFFIALPLTFILSNYFMNSRIQWFGEVMFFLMVLVHIYIQLIEAGVLTPVIKIELLG